MPRYKPISIVTLQVLEEYTLLLKLKHELLVQGLSVFIREIEFGRKEVNMVMAYMEGGDLSRYLRLHHPLGEERVTQLLTQLLVALEYIHGQGIVHGDIKPANVLLSADFSQARLADFFLARRSPRPARASLCGGRAPARAARRFRSPALSATSRPRASKADARQRSRQMCGPLA